jgi:hypothetical protein
MSSLLLEPVTRISHLILGQLETIESGAIRGWAIDRLNPLLPLQLRVTIDGQLEAVIDCNIARPPALPALPIESRHGSRTASGMSSPLQPCKAKMCSFPTPPIAA